MIKNTISILTTSFLFSSLLIGQGSQLQSIEDVISGIDSLLQEIDGAGTDADINMPTLAPENRPFRAENELMPKELIKETDSSPATPPAEASWFRRGIFSKMLLSMKKIRF